MISARHTGSSPLARGLRAGGHDLRPPHRIIPARAGFTTPGPDHALRGRDHPRSRGVYGPTTRPSGRPCGSSPLARGLRQARRDHPLPPGIIPARAGFTRREDLLQGAHEDHPRSRGVYGAAVGRRWSALDHPRSRGVYNKPATWTDPDLGSSPLARGLRGAPGGLRGGLRIIPVRAGFTRRAGRSARGPRDHPRSRGVYILSRWRRTASRGSSPLARGLQITDETYNQGNRIIPARAGFTRAHRVHEPGPPARRIIPARAGFT